MNLNLDYLWLNVILCHAISFVIPWWFITVWLRKKITEMESPYKLTVDDSLSNLQNLTGTTLNGAHLAIELANRGNTSLRIVAEFTEYHYFALLAAIISAVIGGVATFLVATDGWNKTDVVYKGLFLGSASSLAFWLTIIQVFRYNDAIVKHETVYTSCANLLAELQDTLRHPPKCTANGSAFLLEDYLRAVLKKCESMRTIGITFDGSKISRIKIEMPK